MSIAFSRDSSLCIAFCECGGQATGISSRKPDDLTAFNKAIIEPVVENRESKSTRAENRGVREDSFLIRAISGRIFAFTLF